MRGRMGSRLRRWRKKKFKWNNNASIAPEDDTLKRGIWGHTNWSPFWDAVRAVLVCGFATRQPHWLSDVLLKLVTSNPGRKSKSRLKNIDHNLLAVISFGRKKPIKTKSGTCAVFFYENTSGICENMIKWLHISWPLQSLRLHKTNIVCWVFLVYRPKYWSILTWKSHVQEGRP